MLTRVPNQHHARITNSPAPNAPTNCIIRWIYSCTEHHKEALAYLGFKPVPKQGMLAQRTWCLAQEYARQQPRDVDDSVFAAGLYSSIADISIKVRNTASNSDWFMLGYACVTSPRRGDGEGGWVDHAKIKDREKN